MTEKWGQILGKWDLVRVSEGVQVIRVRLSGFYCTDFAYIEKFNELNCTLQIILCPTYM